MTGVRSLRPAAIPEPDMDDLSAPSPWQASRFEIRTRIEPLDYLRAMAVLKWTGLERFVAWLPMVGISGIGAIAALVLLDVFVPRLPVYPYWDWALATAIAGALVAFVLYKVFVVGPYVELMFQGQPIGMGELTIVADTKGVTATSAGVETRISWDKVQNVIVTNEHLFLMFARLVGVTIPRRAFANDSEAQRFAEFVRSKAQRPLDGEN